MSEPNLRECGSPTCYALVNIDNRATVAVPHRLSPHTQTYYHSTCYDPWAEVSPIAEGGMAESLARGLLEAHAGRARVRDDLLAPDPVSAPAHYRWLPNGIEVIDITETLNFCMGNAIKYILRADHKGRPEEDLKKAAWYIERELERRSRDNGADAGVV